MDLDSEEFGHNMPINGMNTNNWLVINGPIQNPLLRRHGNNNSCNYNGLENSIVAGERNGNRILAMGSSLLSFFQRSPYVLLLIVVIMYLSPLIFMITCGVIVMISSKGCSKTCKRTVNWTVSTEDLIHENFLTSPSFADKSGNWRLVIRQKNCMDGTETSLGLIATNVPKEIDSVSVTADFTCVNTLGQDLSPGYRSLNFTHKFSCPGDCGYTRPFVISENQFALAENTSGFIISCRAEFSTEEIGIFKAILYKVIGGQAYAKKGRNSVPECGSVAPDIVNYPVQSNENHVPRTIFTNDVLNRISTFLQHSDTKRFIWEIPNLNMEIENSECWGIFSPQFFVNSHEFCSIWRLKLIELQGVFRLHLQLRGLPSCMRQVKLWYLVQLIDNAGNSVVPENSVTRVKHPDHLNLWETIRHILYRRDFLLQRYLSATGNLYIKISMQVEANDLRILESVDSDDWILSSED